MTPPGSIVVDWNNTYLDCVRRIGGAPGPLARIGGLMHLAMFEAANLLTSSPPRYRTSIPGTEPPTEPSNVAATVAYAARYALLGLLPAYIEADLAAQKGAAVSASNQYLVTLDAKALLGEETLHRMLPAVASTGDPAMDDAAEALGKRIAEAILADNPVGGGLNSEVIPPLKPEANGEWRETGSGAAATPQWGKVKLALLRTSKDEYFPEQTIPLNLRSYTALLASKEYAGQVDEVQQKGAALGSTRTADETAVAYFWANDLDKTYKPPGQLYSITQIVARQEGTLEDQKGEDGLLETARLFAMAGIAMLNASIVAWQAKYFWPDKESPLRLWRPESAIRGGATSPDPTWQPLSKRRDETPFSPNFPAFVSGHSTFGAAHAAAMIAFFGKDDISFDATTEDPHAVSPTRHFDSFTEAAKENGRSRVYLGVHYQFDADGGYEIGIKVGQATANWFEKVDADGGLAMAADDSAVASK